MRLLILEFLQEGNFLFLRISLDFLQQLVIDFWGKQLSLLFFLLLNLLWFLRSGDLRLLFILILLLLFLLGLLFRRLLVLSFIVHEQSNLFVILVLINFDFLLEVLKVLEGIEFGVVDAHDEHGGGVGLGEVLAGAEPEFFNFGEILQIVGVTVKIIPNDGLFKLVGHPRVQRLESFLREP